MNNDRYNQGGYNNQQGGYPQGGYDSQGGYNQGGYVQGGYNTQSGYNTQGGYDPNQGYNQQGFGNNQGGMSQGYPANNQGMGMNQQGMMYNSQNQQGGQVYMGDPNYSGQARNVDVVVMGVTSEAPGNIVYDTSYVQHHEDPVSINCPYCKAVGVYTEVRRQPGGLTWCCALIICILFFPLAWIPFCVKSCLDAYHYCPNCRNFVGKKSANF